MKLDTASIANVARGAGFVGRELHVATAVALASSGGLTHYHHTYGLPGTGDLRGLWAIDVDRWPGCADVDLYEPHTAAQAAQHLTDLTGGFGWSAVYRAGTWARHEAHAATESTKPLHRQPGTRAMTVNGALDLIDHNAAQIRRLRAKLHTAPRRGGS